VTLKSPGWEQVTLAGFQAGKGVPKTDVFRTGVGTLLREGRPENTLFSDGKRFSSSQPPEISNL
jgi:hypothetical protein